jgi:hypothetical protein
MRHVLNRVVPNVETLAAIRALGGDTIINSYMIVMIQQGNTHAIIYGKVLWRYVSRVM